MLTTRLQYRDDLHPSVETKISELARHRALVHDLEQKLSVAREVCGALEIELSPYLEFPSVIKSCRISLLPSELLVEIFTLYLKSVGHPFIRRLILVCRRWHHLVVRTASLWTTIHAKPIYPSVQHPNPYSELRLYIKACLQRSETLPLDINIKFTWHVDSPDDLAALQIRAIAEPLIDTSHRETAEWFRRIRGEQTSASQAVKREHQYLLDAIRLLVSHQSRWRTLRFSAPGWKSAHRIPREILAEASPNLVLFHTDTKLSVFGEMPSLKALKVHLFDNLVEEIFNKDGIERLDVKYLASTGFKMLANWASLRELRCTYQCRGSYSRGNSREVIRLPVLRNLTLYGYNHPCHNDFDLPSLVHMTLKRCTFIPNISVPSLCLDLSKGNPGKEDLYAYLCSLGTTQNLVVYGSKRDWLEEALEDSKKANGLTPTLQAVTWAESHRADLEFIDFTPTSATDYIRPPRKYTVCPHPNYAWRPDSPSSSDTEDDKIF
ncbi:hypothetical protein FS842_010812 [Serendipita sp. 407]|nr:hypothetical protein FS842_010812 [Serendipita sp. 407]